MAESNLLTGGGVNQLTSPQYPTFQPIQPANPLAQISQAVGVASQLQGLQQQQQALGMQRLNYMHDQLGSLAAKVDPQTGKPNATYDDVVDVATNLARMGYPTEQVTAELAKFHGLDSAQIQGKALQHMAGIADHAQRMTMGYGAPVTQDQGGATLFGTRSATNPGQVTLPGATQSAAGTSLPNTMPPALKVQSQRAVVGGIPVDIPNASRFTPTGDVPPAAPQIGASAAANMAPRGMALPPGTVQAQQAPGVDASANAAASSDAQRATSFEDAASRVPDTKAILDRMDANAATFTGGPASPLLKKAGGYINQIATGAGLPTPIQSQAAREAFDKDAALLAGQQKAILGNTDASQSLASVMTPGSSNTNEGIRNIAAVLKGNQDAIAAKAQAWNAYKNSLPAGNARFSDFETNFNTHFSPRAFAMPYMSQAERQKMWNNMSVQERTQVQRSYDEAKAKGYLGAAQGSPAPSPTNARQ